MRAKLPVSRDITHTTLSVLSIGVLIVSTFWVLRPFLVSIIWAGLIVIATWPVLEKLEARFVKKRGFAVALMTLALLLIVLIPITLAIVTIVDNASTISEKAQSLPTFSLSSPPDWLKRIPAGRRKACGQMERVCRAQLPMNALPWWSPMRRRRLNGSWRRPGAWA